MIHRTVRHVSTALFAVLALGCSDSEPMSTAPEDRFVVTPNFVGIDPGATQQMTATLGDQPVAVTWASSDPAVATVSATGLVTGLTPGFTAITAAITAEPARLLSGNITVQALLGTGLTKGVGVGPLSSSAARGSTVLYRLFVPPGATSFTATLSGGTGDADLYIRRASPPTTSSNTCGSENGGNDEICTVANPASGTWYILIALYDPYAGATLRATFTP